LIKGVGEGCALSQGFLVTAMMEHKEMLRPKGVHFSGLKVYEGQQKGSHHFLDENSNKNIPLNPSLRSKRFCEA